MKLLLLILLAVSLGYIETGSSKQECAVTYNYAGVAVTDMQLDYPKIYAGNRIRLSLEVANTGEETGKDVALYVIGPDNYFSIPEGSVISKTSMEPPDPNKCIEGGITNAVIALDSKPGSQVLDGTPIKLKLTYSYMTHAWSDVVVLSEQQWAMRVQEGYVPQLYQGQTVAPIRINMGVPAVPVISNSTFYVQLSLENAAGTSEKSKSTSSEKPKPMLGTESNIVEKVTVTIPDKFMFVDSSACTNPTATACTIQDFEVTTDKENIKEKKLSVRLKDAEAASLVEENFKIRVEAEYDYNVFYDTKPVIIVGDS